jgi:hypothetical protein
MKNTLYVIGDSFSAKYNHNVNIDSNYNRYRIYKGGELPKTWSELLSEELNLNLVNLASGGNSNGQIIDDFCKISTEISKNDLLFIGWTDTMRFRLYSEINKTFVKTNLNDWDEYLPNISKNTIEEIRLNRSDDYWTNEIYSWENVIKRLSKLVGFKLYIWSFFTQFPDYNILQTLLDMGATRISEETNGLINDNHFGEKGHQIQFEYFIDKIKNPKLI